MTEADPQKKSHWPWWLAGTIVALLVIYPLSMPPVEIIAAQKGWTGLAQFARVFYRPLTIFLNSHPSIFNWYAPYMMWWLHILH